MPENNQFAAVNPALGYLYQVRAALLWSLQRLRHDESFQVSLEVLDDVAFESGLRLRGSTIPMDFRIADTFTNSRNTFASAEQKCSCTPFFVQFGTQ